MRRLTGVRRGRTRSAGHLQRIALACLFAFGAASANTILASPDVQLDPKFRGFWILNIAKSDFGGEEKPKSGLVNWTDAGFVFAIVTANGSLYADAVVLNKQCGMIGVPASYSCDFRVLAPRHCRLTVRDGESVRRVADIELLDDNTTRTVHHVTPSNGKPYDEKTLWERQQ